MIEATPQNALEIGKAAEYIVCADVILQGFRAFPSDQGLPYDVVIDTGSRMLRVQVRSSTRPRNVNAQGRNERLAYSFHVRRVGKTHTARLTNADCDLVALVALDLRVVAYLPIAEVGQTVQLLPPGGEPLKSMRTAWQSIDQFPLSAALERHGGGEFTPRNELTKIEFNGERKSITEWSRETGLSTTTISQRIRGGWTPERALTARLHAKPRPLLEYQGRTLSNVEWARETGIPAPTIGWRRAAGWAPAQVLGYAPPPNQGNGHGQQD